MTREEFLKKYKGITVTFHNYYKYTFNYVGVTDDDVLITMSYGGNTDDIYRHSVSHDDKLVLDEEDFWSSGTAYKNDELIEYFYDY